VRLYLLVVVGLLTYTMQQNGYRAAGLAAFLPVFSVLDPAVGSLLGLLLYHEHLGGGAGRIAIEAAAVLAATWGIAKLARSTAEPAPIEPARPPVLAGPLRPALPAALPVALPVGLSVALPVGLSAALPTVAIAVAADDSSVPAAPR